MTNNCIDKDSKTSKSKKLSISELQKCLRNISWNQLEEMICTLYHDSDQAKLYFNSIFNPDIEDSIAEEYEKKLTRCFAFSNPNSPDMKTGKQLVNEAQKLTSPGIALNVALTFIELANDFTNTYGDINGSFYNTLMRTFSQVVESVNKDKDLYFKYKDRIRSVVLSASGIGWGYGDEMEELWNGIIWELPDETVLA